ncbi:MAG TPA: SDR family oxidoreductase [Verrucomicrobiota bacterium]|nr:SDR family oxidoreductase [Verrucomicrobiota bacterium]HQK00549.1 SDR family oxidoreductase [Verrucomicrobiota bacterium]
MKRRILIVGASSVLGQACAERLARDGESLWLTYRSPSKADALSERFPEAQLARLDVLEPDAIRSFIAEVGQAWNGLDGLVCAFGVGCLAPGHLIDTARVREIAMVNIESVILLLKHAFPALAKGQHPSVVLMSSTMGLVGAAGMSAYSATKGAVSSLARSLAVEWAPRKIRVNAVAPGVVMSPLVSQMFSLLTIEQVQAIERRHPLGFGQPEDAANAVRFLLSPEAKWLTGVVLPVDGGYTAQ